MTNPETKPEEHQLSFAEAFLDSDSLKWGEIITKVPLEQLLQFLQDSPVGENMEIYKTTRRSIEIKFPIPTSPRLRPDQSIMLITDGDEPEIKDNQLIYSPKSYLAWITRTPKASGFYEYAVVVDTVLRAGFDNLQSSLKGEESPLIPNLIPFRPVEEYTQMKPAEDPLQAAFIPIPRAS